MVLNLSVLNMQVKQQNIIITTVERAHNILKRRVLTISLDLRDAYGHLLIHPSMRFMSFHVSKEIWLFRVMPFGLSIAPEIFLPS